MSKELFMLVYAYPTFDLSNLSRVGSNIRKRVIKLNPSCHWTSQGPHGLTCHFFIFDHFILLHYHWPSFSPSLDARDPLSSSLQIISVPSQMEKISN